MKYKVEVVVREALLATRLADLERDARKEQRQAARWAEKNGVGSMPGRRAENGESDVREKSTLFSGTVVVRVCLCDHLIADHDEKTLACLICSDCTSATWDVEKGKTPEARKRVYSLDGHDSLDDWEQHQLKVGTRYTVLAGGSTELGPDELATRAKVTHVMEFILPMHVELLNMRHVEQLTWEAMAAEFGCSYQAVQDRLRVAEQDFHRLWDKHSDDPIDWKDAL